MRVKQKLVAKVMLVLLVVMVGSFGYLTRNHVVEHEVLLREAYESRALSISYAMDANIRDSSDLIEDKLMQGINKHIWLNPDVLEIKVDVFDGKELKTIASNNPVEIGQEAGERRKEVFENDEVNFYTVDAKGERALRAITPVHVSGKNVGTYTVDLSLVRLDEQLREELSGNILKYGIVIAVMMGLMFVIFQILVLKPLKLLSIGMRKILDEGEEHKIVMKSNDELGRLGEDFNKMAEQIRESKLGLEMKVKEKTKELSLKMEELQNKAKDREETQKAMINLLEDAKELEEDLKTEKEGVDIKIEERTGELTKQTHALEEARQKATAGWKQLQVEKARLNASMEALPLGLVILDIHHEVIVFNQKVLDLSENIIGKESDTGQFDKFINELGLSVDEICPHCNNSKMFINEAIFYKNKFIKVMVVPVKSGEEVIGSTYLFEDVTEARKLQKTRDEFFSVASHELRTPLTAIRGNTQMLQDYYPEVQENLEVKEMLTDIHTASVRLISIVNDFLDASRLELKKTEMKLSQFSLKELLKDTMEQVSPKSMGKELEYKLSVSENEAVMVNADKDRLQQVLINLIGNAFKFTKEGGVYIDVENGDEGLVKVKITDTGVGISSADQTELFAKFKQVGSNVGLTRDISGGTGMGLYISKLIMDAMGGKVYLEKSEEGKGSVFVVEVPKAS